MLIHTLVSGLTTTNGTLTCGHLFLWAIGASDVHKTIICRVKIDVDSKIKLAWKIYL